MYSFPSSLRGADAKLMSSQCWSLDYQRVWLCGNLWSSLMPGGGRDQVVQLRPKAESRTEARPRPWRRCISVKLEEMYFTSRMRDTSFASLRAPQSERSVDFSPEGGFEGIEKVFAAVGLGGAQLPPARMGILSQDLLESPNGAQPRRGSAAN